MLAAWLQRLRDRRRWQERGAAALVLALVTCFIAIPMGALVVDIGMQRIARSDAQAVADTAALDATRSLTAASNDMTATQDARASAKRDQGALGNIDPDSGVVAKVGYIEPGSAWVRNQALGCDGTYTGDYFKTTIPSGQSPNAVLVVVKNRVEFGLAKAIGASSGGVCRSAVATTDTPSMCFSVGTTLLELDTTKSALSPLLDGILQTKLNVADPSGLVDLKSAYVPIAALLADLNITSTTQLASTDVSLADFMLAAAKVASDAGFANASLIDMAATLNAQSFNPPLTVPVGDILSLGSGTDLAGLTASANLLDLVAAAVYAAYAGADGQAGTPDDWGLAASVLIPGAGTGATLHVTQPPQIACGKPADHPTASSAQLDLEVNEDLSDSVLSKGVAGVTSGSVVLDVDVAAGDATLTGIDCSPLGADFDVNTAGVWLKEPAQGTDGKYGQINLALKPSVLTSTVTSVLKTLLGSIAGGTAAGIINTALSLLGLGEVQLDVGVDAKIASDSGAGTMTFPGTGLPDPQDLAGSGAGSSILAIDGGPNVAIVGSGVVGALGSYLTNIVGDLTSAVVTPVVNGVLSDVVTPLVTPLLTALGIDLGETEVVATSRPSCAGVRLDG